MAAFYNTRWLRPKLNRQITRFARRVGREPARLQAFLTATEQQETSLSVGVFCGSRLVGYLLAWLDVADRSALSANPGATCASPAALGPCLRVVDFAMHPRHRSAARLLVMRFAALVRERDDLRELPVCAHLSPKEAQRWRDRSRFLTRIGYRPANSSPLVLRLEPYPPPAHREPRELAQRLRSTRKYATLDGEICVGTIENHRDWTLLEPWWNKLATAGGATVFQSYEYLRAWWTLKGWGERLWIAVALRNGQPIGIAPMQLTSHPWAMFRFRRLSFLGLAPEADRPVALISKDDTAILEKIAQYILDRGDEWDQLALAEQEPNGAFARALSAGHMRRQLLRGESSAGECLTVAIQGPWARFLESKPKAVRKSVKRKISALAAVGRVNIEITQAGDDMTVALERYLRVERASWKAGTAIGVAQSSAHLAFYRRLVRRLAPRRDIEFRFLTLNDYDIAATFGLLWNRIFYSLHIVYDEAYADHSPGVVLTAKELEEAFTNHRYDVFDFLTGALPNKASWATDRRALVDVYLNRCGLQGLLFHGFRFKARPALRTALIRSNLLPHALRFKSMLLRAVGRDQDA